MKYTVKPTKLPTNRHLPVKKQLMTLFIQGDCLKDLAIFLKSLGILWNILGMMNQPRDMPSARPSVYESSASKD